MTPAKPTGRPHKASQARLRRMRDQGLKDPIPAGESGDEPAPQNAVVDCGWGRLIFAQTFDSPQALVDAIRAERDDTRDIAVYVRDPHVVLAAAPQEVFLDPSHTYRMDLSTYRPGSERPQGYFLRRLCSEADAIAVNRLYAAHAMVSVDPTFFWRQRDSRALTFLVAEDERTGEIIGAVTGVDHGRAFGDPEKGASLWCLAVDPATSRPGVGETLVRRLTELLQARGCAFMDLSVLHDNSSAIGLYEKLGFRRVPFFTLKRKNVINEKLFMGSGPEESLNPYARIIVDEARRRGIGVDVLDVDGGFFRLTYGGRAIVCRESLSDLTTAIAMSRCDDKAVTRRLMQRAGVPVPEQIVIGSDTDAPAAFLERHGSVVVKPARGEQGRGVVVGITDPDALEHAIEAARALGPQVIIEEEVAGQDLRVLVIQDEVVAAALRKPPSITGDGRRSARDLIERLSRRREAATDGESRIPIDAETRRCLNASGLDFDDVPPEGQIIPVRKTANMHTGGTLEDVTGRLHPAIRDSALTAARALEIPVVGLDFIVDSPAGKTHVLLEANERPGLANHEPQPTAERFVDLLFPLSVARRRSQEER